MFSLSRLRHFVSSAASHPHPIAETRILSSRSVAASLRKGLRAAIERFFTYFVATKNRCVNLVAESLAP
jgi:hypothetical protein